MKRPAPNGAIQAAKDAITGTSLKLRWQSDGEGFAITERLAPLLSSLWWSQPGELAVHARHDDDGWELWFRDRRGNWTRTPAVPETGLQELITTFVREHSTGEAS